MDDRRCEIPWNSPGKVNGVPPLHATPHSLAVRSRFETTERQAPREVDGPLYLTLESGHSDARTGPADFAVDAPVFVTRLSQHYRH